jgi:hypothetical protein
MTTQQTFTHARFAKKDEGYELSSHGDRRFSALFCRLRDGRTIEQAYQLDVKGYRLEGDDWRLGKGKPAINGKNPDQLWDDYLCLWRQWTQENPLILEDLREKATGKILTDKFASSPVSQARALAQILNETGPQPKQTRQQSVEPSF